MSPGFSDAGDKDARDSVRMRLEQRLRDGQEDGSVVERQVGTFERHTKVSRRCALPTAPLCSSSPSCFALSTPTCFRRQERVQFLSLVPSLCRALGGR